MGVISSVWDSRSSAPSGAAGGDLNGSYPNPGVATVGGKAAAAIGALPSLTTTVDRWFAEKAQSPLHAGTDYFPGSSLNARWSAWNPGSNTTTTVATATKCKITQTSSAGNHLGGIRQAAPAAARYALTAKLGISGYENNLIDGGIFVAGDISGSPTTAAILSLDLNYGSGSRPCLLSLLDWTKYDTISGAAELEFQKGLAEILLRIFVDTVGQKFSMLASQDDGYTWTKFFELAYASSQLNANPSYIGMHINNANTGEDASLYSSMFRVDDTTDPFLACGGFHSVGVA